ncbi:YjbH domain-containing protein [Catenovulum sediminis]|uniref:YjbH domain-containing protein n=1 Tax=Catenovulum sediminis TaxID=1740262 RepID=UPI00117CC331|nr:YjbH domain-containing protein [Catenovulum sediminis]
MMTVRYLSLNNLCNLTSATSVFKLAVLCLPFAFNSWADESASTSTSSNASSSPYVTPSLQGFGGYFNTPSAYSFGGGQGVFMYSNQTERLGSYRTTPNFHFAAGLWDNLEVSGRNAAYEDTTSKSSDLSANIKFALPYIPENWFKLAVGIQDLGGAANHFDSKYVVLSRYFADYNFDASVGVGQSESRLGRLDGTFAAVKWQPYDWGAVLLEHDAISTNYGIELSTPKNWLGGHTRFFAKAMLGASEDALSDETYWGIGLNTNLYQARADIEPARIKYVAEPDYVKNNTANQDAFLLIRQALRARGFTDFKIGTAGYQADSQKQHLVIAVENNLYSGNHIDTFAVVLSIVSKMSPESVEHFTVQILQSGIQVDAVSGNLNDYRAFLQGADLKLAEQPNNAGDSVNWLKEDSSFFIKPKLTFYPHLVTTVGTELGMLDYSLAWATHLELPIPLWPGLTATAFHLKQLRETEDFRDGKFFAGSRQQTGIHNLMLHQTFELPFNTKLMLNYGEFSQDYRLSAVEAGWQSDNGQHHLFYYYGQYNHTGEKELGYDQACVKDPSKPLYDCYGVLPQYNDKTISVAKYRYYSPWLNTSFFTKYGKFWSGDEGLHLLVSRHFDDVEVNLQFKATKNADEGLMQGFVYEDEYQKTIGLGFTVALGPRKDFNSRYINIRGRADWSYIVNTLVGEEHNGLTYGLASEARTFYHLDNHFNNFGRKGLSYLYKHQDRLRAAYFELR